MERLDVQLLGGVEVTLDGRPVEFESDTARALLARVAAAPVGETVTRAAIAEMLWPERPEGAARANLRHTLASVRHAIGDVDADVPFLKVSRTSLGVDPLASAHVDVAELRRLAATSPDAPGAVAAWDRAAALRRGPFLDGLDPPVDATWEEWVRAVRAELDQVAVEALRRVADVRERAGELAEARRVARRWIELEPWDERAHRLVARTLAAERQAARAVDHLERFAGRLREELGVEATAETIALLEAVRAGAAVTPAPVVAARKAPGPVMQLVDRGDELHRLECRLDDAMAGRGGLALVSGEAGTGKTVLMRALAVGARARMSRLVTVEGRCDAHWGAGDPFLPFRQVLATLSGDEEQPVVADVSSPERVAEVTTCVIEAIVEDGPYLLGTLVDVDALDARARAALGESPLAARLAAATANARLRATDPTRQQRPVLDQCVHVLRRVAGSAPLLLLVDDLQWADHATIDLLFRLARGLAGVPVLVVGAFRPEELDGSGDGPHPLRRLARELELEGAIDPVVLDSRPGFVDAWLDREPNALGEDFRVRLRAFTGGHPLATVELVGAMIERGELRRDASSRWVVASDPDWRSVPPRIEAMIGSRLDRLPPGVRATLEAASVQGDEFTVEVLAAATGERAVDITREVAHLAEQDHPLVVSVGTERLDGALLQRYRFRHVLFQRHLYDAMPTPERVALHDATARALEATHAGHEDAVAIELASHFDAAQAVDEAINYHGLAARQAMVRVADAEAVGHLERALALLDTERPDRDDEPDGIARRLELLSALASCLQTHDGWTAPRPAAVWERIRDLCDRAGPTMEAAQALGALIAFDELRGHYAEALAGAAHLRDISEQLGLPFLASVGWMQAGMVHPLVGRPVDADVCLRRALELYDPERDGWLTYVVGQDVEVTSRAWSALVHWHLGRFDRSRREADAAIARARVIGHPTSLAFALGVAGGLVANTRGDFEGSSEAMAELADLAEREDLAFYRATALVHGGLAHGTLGDPVAGAAEIGRGIDAWTAIGTVAYVAWSSTTRAQLLIDAGRLDEAAAVLDAVEVQVDTGEEQIALQRMWFMRGRLRRAQGDRAGAQEAFRRAVAIAASWRAIGLQVEASNALAELLDRRR